MKISPHVQIYKFPISAITSIMNRITGFSLSGFFICGGLSNYYGSNIHNLYNSLSILPQKTLDFCIVFPCVYHTYGGIRHFLWDKYPTSFLTNHKVSRSSYILLSSSFVSTGLLEYFDIVKLFVNNNVI